MMWVIGIVGFGFYLLLVTTVSRFDRERSGEAAVERDLARWAAQNPKRPPAKPVNERLGMIIVTIIVAVLWAASALFS